MTNQIVIRPAVVQDAEVIAQIHIKAWQESYRGIIADSYLDSLSFRKRLNLRKKILLQNKPDSLHLVAIYDGDIIGFCDAGPSFGESPETSVELYAIYLLDKYKRKGIGTQMVRDVEQFFTKNSAMPYKVWVLSENQQACSFYEKLGGKITSSKEANIGDQKLKEVCYVISKIEG